MILGKYGHRFMQLDYRCHQSRLPCQRGCKEIVQHLLRPALPPLEKWVITHGEKSLLRYASGEVPTFECAMRKADYIRLLCRCPVCGRLGDEQAMVRVGPMGCLTHD